MAELNKELDCWILYHYFYLVFLRNLRLCSVNVMLVSFILCYVSFVRTIDENGQESVSFAGFF
jgi:hypothetical protein